MIPASRSVVDGMQQEALVMLCFAVTSQGPDVKTMRLPYKDEFLEVFKMDS